MKLELRASKLVIEARGMELELRTSSFEARVMKLELRASKLVIEARRAMGLELRASNLERRSASYGA